MAETPTAGTAGSQVAGLGTEYVLYSVAAAGLFTMHVDLVNMAIGDVTELRIYQIILTGGTARVAYLQRYAGAQPTDDMIKISVPIANELTDSGSLKFTLKQTFGTARAYPFKVLTY